MQSAALSPAPSFLPRRQISRLKSRGRGANQPRIGRRAVGVYVCRVRVSPFGRVPRLQISARVGVEEGDNMYS